MTSEMPEVIATYLRLAGSAGRAPTDEIVACFTRYAEVVDEGETWRSPDWSAASRAVLLTWPTASLIRDGQIAKLEISPPRLGEWLADSPMPLQTHNAPPLPSAGRRCRGSRTVPGGGVVGPEAVREQ